MREVKFVRSLNIEHVQLAGRDEIIYWNIPAFKLSPIIDQEGALITQEPERGVAQVVTVCEEGRPNTYIAWSEEVEETLGIPIRAMKRQIDAEASNNASMRRDIRHLEEAHKKALRFGDKGIFSRLRMALRGEVEVD